MAEPLSSRDLEEVVISQPPPRVYTFGGPVLFFSVRHQTWLTDPMCCHCKRRVATCTVGRAYLCGDPTIDYTCAGFISKRCREEPKKLPKKRRVRENKSKWKRGRRSRRHR